MGIRLFLFFTFLVISAFITGCSHSDTDYDYSTDYVQIGCRARRSGAPPEISFFRFGFPWWVDKNGHNTLYGLDLSPIIDDEGKLNGLGISWMSVREYTNGVIISPICSSQRETRGVSLSLFNFTTDYCPGMQIGLANLSLRFVSAAHAAGPWVQLGLLNAAPSSMIQLGLLNYNEDSCFCRWFPLFNFAGLP